jgi:ribonuclease D
MNDVIPVVREPRDGVPDVIVTDRALREAAAQIAQGTGPVALDAERASGFRYRQRAYLVQLRREGSGTHLLDPTAFDEIPELITALEGTDWLLHAASQDLACLAELGLRPTASLFDTELSARLLGYERVGLSALLEADLGVSLAKEHSAADWSRRPLPDSWLAYAALDVEFLGPLWDVLKQKLIASEKFDLAVQEFEHVVRSTGPVTREEPWRRTSGMHKVGKPADLAVVRDLWLDRDAVASEVDIAPGRLLPDASIVAIALSPARTANELRALPELKVRVSKRHVERWIRVVMHARELPSDQWPNARARTSGIPQPRQWEQRNPVAWHRLTAMKERLAAISEQMTIPVEHLVTPDVMRRIVWEAPASQSQLDDALNGAFVRPWQQELVRPLLAEVLELS